MIRHTLIVVSLLALSSTAIASGSKFTLAGNAITQCRGALPVYESGLRSRPLALANEGTRSTFINCGFVRQSNSYGIEKITLRMGNLGTQPYTTTCTGIGGVENRNGITYTLRSVAVNPGQITTVTFMASQLQDSGNLLDTNASVQCIVPVGGTITEIESTFRHSN